jgi:SAM-dependent methyltransferase
MLRKVTTAAKLLKRATQEGWQAVTTSWSPIRRMRPRYRRFDREWPIIDKIEGFLVPGQEWWLYNTACDLRDGAVIVEIGSFKGRSTACLALGCLETSKRVYAIDTFNGNDVDFEARNYFDQFQFNLERLRLSAYVYPLVGWSTEIGKQWTEPIDLLFIDGSHQYDDVLADFESFYPHLKPGGIVAFHDVVETWPGPLKCWQEIASRRLSNIGYCTTLAFGKKRKHDPEKII